MSERKWLITVKDNDADNKILLRRPKNFMPEIRLNEFFSIGVGWDKTVYKVVSIFHDSADMNTEIYVEKAVPK